MNSNINKTFTKHQLINLAKVWCNKNLIEPLQAQSEDYYTQLDRMVDFIEQVYNDEITDS